MPSSPASSWNIPEGEKEREGEPPPLFTHALRKLARRLYDILLLVVQSELRAIDYVWGKKIKDVI